MFLIQSGAKITVDYQQNRLFGLSSRPDILKAVKIDGLYYYCPGVTPP
jgi:hypothetical protein